LEVGQSRAQKVNSHAQTRTHSHNLAPRSLIATVMTLHFVPALIWITSYKWEQQQK